MNPFALLLIYIGGFITGSAMTFIIANYSNKN